MKESKRRYNTVSDAGVQHLQLEYVRKAKNSRMGRGREKKEKICKTGSWALSSEMKGQEDTSMSEQGYTLHPIEMSPCSSSS